MISTIVRYISVYFNPAVKKHKMGIPSRLPTGEIWKYLGNAERFWTSLLYLPKGLLNWWLTPVSVGTGSWNGGELGPLFTVYAEYCPLITENIVHCIVHHLLETLSTVNGNHCTRAPFTGDIASCLVTGNIAHC